MMRSGNLHDSPIVGVKQAAIGWVEQFMASDLAE